MKKRILLFLFILPAFYAPCQVMKLTSGVTLDLSSGALITLDNLTFENDGTLHYSLQPGGNGAVTRLVFSGNQNTSISGTSLTYFGDIEIAKTGGAELSLMRDLLISNFGTIYFTSGLLNLNTNAIKLSTYSRLFNESETSHIYGDNGGFIEILHAFSTAPNTQDNPGNLGLIISNPQGAGTIIVRRGHQSQLIPTAGKSILRYYDLFYDNTPANHRLLNSSFRFKYFDSELNGLNENNIVLWKSSDNINWTNQGYDFRNTITNYVNGSGADYSRWTLSAPFGARPARSVSSQEITPKVTDNDVHAKDIWKTWPNPVNKTLWIDISATVQSKATTSLFDSKGALIRTQQDHLLPGSNLLTIDIKELAAGIYYISTQWADRQTKRSAMFVKQ